MTREEAKRAAEVMLAYANGETIEALYYGEYVSCEEPTFNWISGKGIENYRIKPKEKFNPKTLQPFLRVLVRNLNETKWLCDYYSYTEENLFVCTSNIKWIYCIPYNNETKHLVGTDKEAPEYYRYWED